MVPKMGRLDDWIASASARPGNSARPLVTLSYAQSLDGSIALQRGQPLKLSSLESLQLTHRLRTAQDAILVGIGTILSDDPQLNVRLALGRQPQIIVLDSRLRFPFAAKAAQNGSKPRLFSTALAAEAKELELSAAGIHIERQAANQTDRVELVQMLARLQELGINSVMVEGGGEVIASFLSAGLVDRALISITPIFLGGYQPLDQNKNGSLPRFKELDTERVGPDLVIWGELETA